MTKNVGEKRNINGKIKVIFLVAFFYRIMSFEMFLFALNRFKSCKPVPNLYSKFARISKIPKNTQNSQSPFTPTCFNPHKSIRQIPPN